MFFKKKDNYEEIKRAVEEPVSSEPTLQDLEIEDLPPEMRYDKNYAEPRDSAPLFVKVEKYKELIGLIQEMRAFTNGLKQTFSVIHESDALRNDAVKIMRTTVQRLDKTLAEIDSELVRPRGIDMEKPPYAGSEMKYIEGSLSELQRHLAVLRKDLQEMKE
ncbi:MAG: hypothetical protein HYW26_02795 [Candidatus Aenigmarchaeota archaeon]|nr:hypothetical protein [Candidatus Aenigmarchaeota archaeon]